MKRILSSQLLSLRAKGRAQELTVDQGEDLVESFGSCTNLFAAPTDLHTDMVATKVFILLGTWETGSNPLETNTLVSDIGAGYGGENKPDIVGVGLYEGKTGEGGGSYGEGHLSTAKVWHVQHQPETQYM